MAKYHADFGALGGTRTPDLLVRSQSLYPAELQAHFGCRFRQLYYFIIGIYVCQHPFKIFLF